MPSLTEMDLLEAFRARLERVRKCNGYFTNLGDKVLVQRADPTPGSDGDELLGVVFIGTEYVSRGSADRDVLAKSQFQVMGYTTADATGQIESTKVLRDLIRAAFEPTDDLDVLKREVDSMLPVSADIYLAREGMSYTFAELILVVTWCDHSVEQYLL